jgi:hypothetical protein
MPHLLAEDKGFAKFFAQVLRARTELHDHCEHFIGWPIGHKARRLNDVYNLFNYFQVVTQSVKLKTDVHGER